MSICNVLALGMPMGSEWLVIGLLGLLIFGKRLPEVGKAVGKTLKQFREGMKGVEQEIADAVEAPTVRACPELVERARPEVVERALLTEPQPPARPAFNFDPYTGKPMDETYRAGA